MVNMRRGREREKEGRDRGEREERGRERDWGERERREEEEREKEREETLTSQSLLMQHDSIHSEETQCLLNVVPPSSGCGRIVVDVMQLYVCCIQEKDALLRTCTCTCMSIH